MIINCLCILLYSCVFLVFFIVEVLLGCIVGVLVYLNYVFSCFGFVLDMFGVDVSSCCYLYCGRSCIFFPCGICLVYVFCFFG